MNIFQTSQDILNIVIAVSIFGLAAFVCWAIFYVVMILRDAYKMTKEVKGWFQKIDDILKILKEKIESSASYLILIGEGVKKLLEIMKDRKEKKEERSDDK